MKYWKKTRHAWLWTADGYFGKNTKKKITRIERRKLKQDAEKEIRDARNG